MQTNIKPGPALIARDGNSSRRDAEWKKQLEIAQEARNFGASIRKGKQKSFKTVVGGTHLSW